MRSKGEGTIQELSGKFRGVAWVRGKRRYGPLVEKRSDALPKLWQKLANEADREAAAGDEPPLSTSLELKIVRNSVWSPTTRDLWRAFQKRIDGDPLGKLQPSEIDDQDVASWVSRQKGAPRTVNNYAGMLRQLLSELGSTAAVKPPPPGWTRPPRILTPDEEAHLLSLPMLPATRTMVLLGLRCGLRRSEMAGLRHEDRDGDGIMISRAVVRVKGAIVIKETKTQRSEAWVPLPAELLDQIGQGEGWVFPAPDGDVPSPTMLHERFKRAVEGTRFAGIGLHDLRRTFGMRLLEHGADVRTASEMMRHDPRMLLEIYTRSRRDLKVAAYKRAFG